MSTALSEAPKRGYSEEELANIYQLARLFIETGNLLRAETVVLGLISVAPDFSPAWLANAYIQAMRQDYAAAAQSAREVLRIEEISVEARLFLAICALNSSDYNSAGTHLGEVSDLIQAGQLNDAAVIRLYKIQMARFEGRAR